MLILYISVCVCLSLSLSLSLSIYLFDMFSSIYLSIYLSIYQTVVFILIDLKDFPSCCQSVILYKQRIRNLVLESLAFTM